MDPQLTCRFCDKIFSTISNLKRHLRNIHDIDKDKVRKSPSLICPICKFEVFQFQNFKEHALNVHDLTLKSEQLQFSSKAEFYLWKKSLELKDQCFYTRRTAYKFTLDNSVCETYDCNRSGFYKPLVSPEARKRELKLQGSCKINGYCPSRLKVLFDIDQSVTVQYCSTHIGHKQELAHIPLKQEERKDFADKIASNISFDHIIQSTRSGMTDLHRRHLITKQDLSNIEREFSINNESVKHPDDATSVDAWVAEEKLSDSNSVILYKPKGVIIENYHCFKNDDFALAIMTKAQRDILMKYGKDCICIDSTHGVNAYGFELTTVMVLDNLRQGFPCAFFISNKSDTQGIQAFLEAIKNVTGVIYAKVFMTDMSDVFYNAWNSVMKPSEKRLFCTWHVDHAWRKNFKKIKNMDKQQQVYNMIRTLLQETDETAFNRMLRNIISTVKNDPITADFGKYFETYYLPIVKSWAYCYRINSGINTNKHLERMHRTIKYMYLKGKEVKRLDKVIHALLQFIKDRLFDRLTVIEKGKITRKLKYLRIRHQKSLNLRNRTALEVDEQSWIVSADTTLQTYKVTLVDPGCNCQLVCSHCQACLHKYRCTCIDSSIKYNMCKHIHLVCQDHNTSNTQNNNLDNPENPLIMDVENNNEKEDAILKEVCFTKNENEGVCVTEDMKMELINEFLEIVWPMNNYKQYTIMKKKLKRLKPLSMATNSTNLVSLPQLTRKHPNKKIDTQRRFIIKKNKTKNRKSIKTPSAEMSLGIAMSAVSTEQVASIRM